MPTIDRRDFIRAGGFVVLGLAVGCAKDAGAPGPAPSAQTLNDVIGARQQKLQVISVGTELIPEQEERVAFGLLDPGTNTPIPNGRARMWVAKTRAETAMGPFTMAYHGEGLGDRGVYATNLTFPSQGAWLAVVELTPAQGETIIGGAEVQVGVRNDMPKRGDPAPVVATPTVDNARGVDPICTRKPACSMHQISLDQALQTGKPTVVIIATPAYCQSALCGPEVDLLQDIATSPEFADKANYIHIEVLANDDPDTVQRFGPLSPASNAFKLEEEPVIYYIDRAGQIDSRHLGPVDRSDIRETVRALVN